MLAVVLTTLGVVIAAYEWIAIRTGRVPTVTDLVKAAGWPVRILVAVAGSLALVDHFVTGWVL